MPVMPILPVQPAFIEHIADAADTSAGKRRAREKVQIIYVESGSATVPAAVKTSLAVAGGSQVGSFQIEALPTDPTVMLQSSIDAFANRSTREQAQSLLRDLRPLLLKAFQQAEYPPLRASEAEDGSAVIEWVFADRRLGFSFEEDPKESGWYFVSSQESGGVLASGDSSSMDLDLLVRWAQTHRANRPPA